jgi:hypothetical protein
MDNKKLLNYGIWATVIGAGLYLLYRRNRNSEAMQQKNLETIVKRYPNWELNNGKKDGQAPQMYAKNFWAVKEDGSNDKELWLIFYNNGEWRIYTRATPEVLVSSGTFTTDNKLEVTEGYNKGFVAKGGSLDKVVEKILKQKVTGLPTN